MAEGHRARDAETRAQPQVAQHAQRVLLRRGEVLPVLRDDCDSGEARLAGAGYGAPGGRGGYARQAGQARGRRRRAPEELEPPEEPGARGAAPGRRPERAEEAADGLLHVHGRPSGDHRPEHGARREGDGRHEEVLGDLEGDDRGGARAVRREVPDAQGGVRPRAGRPEGEEGRLAGGRGPPGAEAVPELCLRDGGGPEGLRGLADGPRVREERAARRRARGPAASRRAGRRAEPPG
mmetsp:Transcript_46443/g.101391  ORF Transcript_46443/g.101391 Transcript_46443/m.101391 type:complete len:237 (+) Transcript_46443:384-1094(+)